MKVLPSIFMCLFLFVLGYSYAHAENRGEYGRADVEVDRSVLQNLEGYTPPPMFGGNSSQRVQPALQDEPQLTAPASDKNPVAATVVSDSLSAPVLTSPDSRALLEHPVENHHVLTLQKSSEIVERPVKKPAGISDKSSSEEHKVALIKKPVADERNMPLLPLPEPGTFAEKGEIPEDMIMASSAAQADEKYPPVPAKKPQGLALTEHIPAKERNVSVITATKVVNAYHPSTPKTMPAVPPIHVEAKPLPAMAGLPPPIQPEQPAKPSVGVRMMDDALTRHMSKSASEVRAALGIESKPEEVEPASGVLDQFSVSFKSGVSELDEDQKRILDQNVIPSMNQFPKGRLEILAFASSTDGSQGSSRRISLSRALSTRSYLLEKGIEPTRIDVRALSDNTQESPVDRMDLHFLK
ncbi:MAG: OmpA family protein [Pseudobdellovibrionaceae bacterium]|jgi:outer membrane protein OmpA-like peptidoglycan-associated protein|nr:OmpA family protein [Pseudobdellovibrionaceae bacterium]